MAISTISDKNELFGGLKARNLDEINTKFICELCKLIVLHPWQLLCCGTLLCKWCLKSGLPNRYLYRLPFNSSI